MNSEIVTEELLLEYGFTKVESIILPSYTIDLSTGEFGYYKMSVTIEQGNEYVMLRQGNLKELRHKDDVVSILNGDIHGRPFHMPRIKELYKALTQKELVKI